MSIKNMSRSSRDDIGNRCFKGAVLVLALVHCCASFLISTICFSVHLTLSSNFRAMVTLIAENDFLLTTSKFTNVSILLKFSNSSEINFKFSLWASGEVTEGSLGDDSFGYSVGCRASAVDSASLKSQSSVSSSNKGGAEK